MLCARRLASSSKSCSSSRPTRPSWRRSRCVASPISQPTWSRSRKRSPLSAAFRTTSSSGSWRRTRPGCSNGEHGGEEPRPVVRLGQNFLADANLLEAIARDADLDSRDVALEVGGGEGALSDRIAPRVAHLHVIELDRRLAGDLEAMSARHPNLSVVWGDAMRVDLG